MAGVSAPATRRGDGAVVLPPAGLVLVDWALGAHYAMSSGKLPANRASVGQRGGDK
jgi:hypothetical protein